MSSKYKGDPQNGNMVMAFAAAGITNDDGAVLLKVKTFNVDSELFVFTSKNAFFIRDTLRGLTQRPHRRDLRDASEAELAALPAHHPIKVFIANKPQVNQSDYDRRDKVWVRNLVMDEWKDAIMFFIEGCHAHDLETQVSRQIIFADDMCYYLLECFEIYINKLRMREAPDSVN